MKKRLVIGVLVALCLAGSAGYARADSWSALCATFERYSTMWYLFYCELAP